MGSCGEANASTAVCTSCCAGVENLCLDNIDGSFLGVLFECFLLIYSFVAVAIIADEHLVCSLETLCVRWNVREDVAGASFMAFGSAAPEIIINAISTLKTVLASGREGGGEAGEDTSLGIGAIIGSGMIAFSFIPGCCGLSATRPLELKRRPLGRDILAYSLALILLFLAISDGKVEAGESAVMLCVYVAYLLIVIFASSIREKYRVGVLGRAARSKSSFVVQAQESLFPGAQQEQGMTPAGLGGGSGGSGGSGGGGGGGGCSDALGDQLSPTGLQPLSLCGTPGPASGASASEDIQMRTPVFDGPSSSSASGAVQTTPTQTPSSAPNCFDITISSTSFASPAGSHPATLPSALRQLLPPIATAGLERLMRLGGLAGRATLAPLMLALRVTCPECAHDSPGARLYPLTLASSFVWVAFFSTLISAVVSRGGELLCIPSIFLGMYIIALGAEIPDTIQSVTVAKRGYGSMAVSNSTGSQIINILIGLGVPWAIMNMAGRPVPTTHVGGLQLMATLQGLVVLTYCSLLLLPTLRTWRPGDHSKASLGRAKGKVLLAVYAVALCIFPLLYLAITE